MGRLEEDFDMAADELDEAPFNAAREGRKGVIAGRVEWRGKRITLHVDPADCKRRWPGPSDQSRLGRWA